jgi:plasminogen activator inhibitor 1 RNA-binding protein
VTLAVAVAVEVVEAEDAVAVVVTVTARLVSSKKLCETLLKRLLTPRREHPKQAAKGWGGEDGNAELADEVAGEAIAKDEEKDAVNDAVGTAEPAAEPEPEDKTISYAAYLAEQAEKKLSLAAQNVRKANEGSKQKFPEGTQVERPEEEAVFFAGTGGKAKRERARKEKNVVELDGERLREAPREDSGRGGRGGRGGGRGRGEGGFRGEGRGRGGGRGRGDRGGGDRGDSGRGSGGRGRGGQSGPTPNVSDTSAFPTLGS